MSVRTTVGWHRAVASASLAAVLVVLAVPSQALAGRLIATGHDADSHCSGYDNSGQCHFMQVALGYVRGGAPNPAKPLLLLDCSPTTRLATAVSNAGAGAGHVTICPSTNPGFPAEPFSTSRYSAIVVGSSGDQTKHRGTPTRSTPARTTSRHSSTRAEASSRLRATSTATIPSDPYYQFIPIGIGGKSVTSPFRLTPEGQALGFQDSVNGVGTNDDINCCPTHNSFQEPAGEQRASGGRARLERAAGSGDAVRRRDDQRRHDIKKRTGGDRPALEQEVRQPPEVKDPHPAAGRRSRSRRRSCSSTARRSSADAQGVPAASARWRTSICAACPGELQGAHRRPDRRGHDTARAPEVPHLHEEAQVEEAAQAVEGSREATGWWAAEAGAF